jgi:chemotaxis protein CheC
MIRLNEHQSEALAELINLAFGLTGAKLSEISGYRLVLTPPVVASHRMSDLAGGLSIFASGEVVSVHQAFSGPFSGEAILFLNHDGALTLSNLLVEEHLHAKLLDTSTGEILCEIGNMLLSACLGVFSNLLQIHVNFSVPQLHQDSFPQFVASLATAPSELQYAVVISSLFRVSENGVDRPMAIILGVSSLEQLAQAVDQWAGTEAATH